MFQNMDQQHRVAMVAAIRDPLQFQAAHDRIGNEHELGPRKLSGEKRQNAIRSFLQPRRRTLRHDSGDLGGYVGNFDTGSVLLPDPARQPDHMVGGLNLQPALRYINLIPAASRASHNPYVFVVAVLSRISANLAWSLLPAHVFLSHCAHPPPIPRMGGVIEATIGREGLPGKDISAQAVGRRVRIYAGPAICAGVSRFSSSVPAGTRRGAAAPARDARQRRCRAP